MNFLTLCSVTLPWWPELRVFTSWKSANDMRPGLLSLASWQDCLKRKIVVCQLNFYHTKYDPLLSLAFLPWRPQGSPRLKCTEGRRKEGQKFLLNCCYPESPSCTCFRAPLLSLLNGLITGFPAWAPWSVAPREASSVWSQTRGANITGDFVNSDSQPCPPGRPSGGRPGNLTLNKHLPVNDSDTTRFPEKLNYEISISKSPLCPNPWISDWFPLFPFLAQKPGKYVFWLSAV